MVPKQNVSRRRFMGGAAAALGYLGLRPQSALGISPPPNGLRPIRDPWDDVIRLSSNENPWGPSDAMMEAMNTAWKYSNRYGYPDGGIRQKIAERDGVDPRNIIVHAGSGETLRVAGIAFLQAKEKVVGVEPTYLTVYRTASGIDADPIARPLLPDYSQDIDDLIKVTKRHYRDVGMVYLCNPNNPTGMIIPASDIQHLLDNIPEDVPVLIDEAYHHFVQDPRYATSVPYVTEGRKVVVTRTFSKIYGLAGMRLGYGIAPPDMIEEMATYSTGSVNALVKWGGVAALEDTETEAWVRDTTNTVRDATAAALREQGFEVLPSETNFIMVHTGRPSSEVREAFGKMNIAVGRDFPPMLDWLRVSISTEEDMKLFMDGWKQIFPNGMVATGNG